MMQIAELFPPLVTLGLALALVPLADLAAAALARRLDAEWRDSALAWAEASAAPEALRGQLAGLGPPTPQGPARRFPFDVGGLMAAGMAGLCAAEVWLSGAGWAAAATGVALTFGLTVAALVDLRIQLLPDAIFWPLAALGAAVSLAALPGAVDPETALTGALAGGGALWALAMLFLLLRGHEGLGLGDVKLVALAGLWLGWTPLPWMMVFASGLGVALHLALRRGAQGGRIPFGPALALAFLLTRLVPL